MLALKNKSAVAAGGKLKSNAGAQQRAAASCIAAAPPRGAARSRRPAVAAAASKSGIGAGAAASSDPPARQAIAGFVSGIYRAAAAFAPADDALPPLWRSVIKLDPSGVADAIRSGADVNERNADGLTPLHFIAREGHYKYPPAGIPLALVQAGADLEAKDAAGRTALEVALLSGWQNIAELLLKSQAQTAGVTAAVKAAVTCPDCKRIIAQYNL